MKFEADIIKFLQGNLNGTWVIIFQLITLFGSILGLFISFFLIFIKNKKLALCLLITYFLSQIVNRILKIIIARERPFVAYDYIINYGGESGYSMPSGHSVGASLFSTFLIYFILKQNIKTHDKCFYIISLIFFAATICLSRMILGVHYLTDLICGIILGILFAIISILLYNVIIKKINKSKDRKNNGRNIIGDNEQ